MPITASGLPIFAEACDIENTMDYDDTVAIIKEALTSEAFLDWLNEKFASTCDQIEASIVQLIDIDGLT